MLVIFWYEVFGIMEFDVLCFCSVLLMFWLVLGGGWCAGFVWVSGF